MDQSIVVIDGPDKGLTVGIKEPIVVMGRDQSCSVSLNDPQVSRFHCEFHTRLGEVVLVDRDSANGTRVNGELVTRRTLFHGDLISIGNTRIRCHLSPPAAGRVVVADLSQTQFIAMDAVTAGASLRETAGGLAELRRAKSDLEVLYRVSRDVSSLLNTAQLLPRLLDLLFEENAKIDRCSIHLVNADSGLLECKAQRIRGRNLLDGEPYSRTLLDQVMHEGRALLTYDAMHDERFRAGDSIRISHICSAICAPLHTQKGIIGILHMDTLTMENRFTRDDLRLMTTVGVLAGAAVENARLYEKIACDKAALHVAHQDLKAAQGGLIQSEKLAAIGRLASGIVHDVKNPLTVILGYAGLIRAKLGERGPDTAGGLGVAEDLENIEKGIEYCTSVIDGLLKFAKPGEPSKTRVNINELILSTVSFVSIEIRKAGVKLRTELGGTLPALMIDESQIKQAMINILLNAVQAMDKAQGLITVRSEAIARSGKKWVRVAFVDNGKGMTEEQRRRVFEPFFTTKEQGSGTGGAGLGLAVSFTLLQANGGMIEAESEAGVGSTFSLLLPAG
jgi:signal transduction histidine kinase